MPWIDGFDQHPGDLGLVLDEGAKLGERPREVATPLAFANRCPVPDAFKVFKSDHTAGVFGLCHDPFADHVIDAATKEGLTPCKPAQVPLGRLGTPVLERSLQPFSAFPDDINPCVGIEHPIAIDGDVNDAHIDPEDSDRVVGCGLRGIDGEGEVEETLAEQQVALLDDSVDAGFLVFADPDGNEKSALEGQDRDLVEALEGKDTVIVDHCRVGTEDVDARLVSAIDLYDLPYGSDSHLGRESVVISEIAIRKVVEFHLGRSVPLEGKMGDVIARLVEPFHRLKERLVLLWRGSQLDHQRLFHASIIDTYSPFVKYWKEEDGAFLCRLKTPVSCAERA